MAGFEHTSELRPMKFKEAMATLDKPHWEVAVKDEYEKMIQYKVWEEVDTEEVPDQKKYRSTVLDGVLSPCNVQKIRGRGQDCVKFWMTDMTSTSSKKRKDTIKNKKNYPCV